MFATNQHNCSFLETHHDHSSLESVRRAAVGSKVAIDSIVVARKPLERAISAAYMPRGGRYVNLVHDLARANNVTAAFTRLLKTYPKGFTQKYGYEPNHMARQLAGTLSFCSETEPTRLAELEANKSALLELAAANLLTYSHVLLYDRLNEIPDYLACAYGCKRTAVSVPAERTHSGRPTRNATVPQPLLELFEDSDDLDKELYAQAEAQHSSHRCAATRGFR